MRFINCIMAFAVIFSMMVACAPEIVQPTAAPVLSAPPVEGEHAAPPVGATPKVPDSMDAQVACVLVQKENGADLECLGLDGQVKAVIQIPGAGILNPKSVHPAGLLSDSIGLMPIVYQSWQPDVSLQVTSVAGIQELRKSGSFFSLAGTAGGSALVVSEAASSPDGVFSALIAGGLQDIGTANAFLERMDAATRMALEPLGVAAAGDTPVGVWHTLSTWGIGSNEQVFPVTRGLSYFDLTTGKDRQVLGRDRSPQGLSPDFRLAASVSFDPQGDRALVVHDLEAGTAIRFELDPAFDRGAGLAVFSRDHSKAAWMEAQGDPLAGSAGFLSRVRIGNTADGSLLHQIEHADAQQADPGFMVALARPVAWLDDQFLLIQVSSPKWDQNALLRTNASNGELAFFAVGRFVDLVFQ